MSSVIHSTKNIAESNQKQYTHTLKVKWRYIRLIEYPVHRLRKLIQNKRSRMNLLQNFLSWKHGERIQSQWRQSSCPQYNPGKCINSSLPSAAYMRQWTRSSLIQVMAVRPVRRKAITWINAGLLSFGLLGTYFSEIWIGILSFSFKKMQLKMSSAKWRPFCPGGGGGGDELIFVLLALLSLCMCVILRTYVW